MTCARGRPPIAKDTERKLFAHSAGRCQKPDCLKYLFFDGDQHPNTIAEMAHIIAAKPGGPRGDTGAPSESLGHFENIILLCADCHTKIDKAPGTFPTEDLRSWKVEHDEKLNQVFEVSQYANRAELGAKIRKELDENFSIHKIYGPDNPANQDPQSELPLIWRRKVRATIIPNSQRVLRLAAANILLLREDERAAIAEFTQHVDDMIARHVLGVFEAAGLRFPTSMQTFLVDP